MIPMNIVLHLPGGKEQTVNLNVIPRIGESLFFDRKFWRIDHIIYRVDHPDAIEISSIVSLDEKLNAEFAKASA